MYKLGSLVCFAVFQEPAFQLSQQSLALQEVLFRNLSELNPRLESFTETGVLSGPAQWSLTFTAPLVNVLAKVQGLETTFLNPRDAIPSEVAGILAQVESGVADVLPEARIWARDFSFHAHFELPSGGYQALTAPFLGQPPEGLGVQLAQGASFYFHTPGVSTDSALILDRSVVITDGLYFQVRSRFGAKDFDLTSSCASFGSLLGKSIEATKLGGAF